MKGPKGYLMTLLNTMSRESGHSLEGKLNQRLARIINRPVTKGQLWPLLLEEYAKRKGLTLPERVKALPKKQPRKKSGGFYLSREWQSVRFDALKKSDGRCCLCGRSKRAHGVVLHVDHIKPRSTHPARELDPMNLQVLCEDCNMGKSNRDDTDWSV